MSSTPSTHLAYASSASPFHPPYPRHPSHPPSSTTIQFIDPHPPPSTPSVASTPYASKSPWNTKTGSIQPQFSTVREGGGTYFAAGMVRSVCGGFEACSVVLLARDQGEYSLSSGQFSLYSLVAGEQAPVYINFLHLHPRLKAPRHTPTSRPSRNAIGPKCHQRCQWLNRTWRLSCRNSLDRCDRNNYAMSRPEGRTAGRIIDYG